METALQICCVPTHDLNKRENKYYIKFVKGMIVDYDTANPEHEKNL